MDQFDFREIIIYPTDFEAKVRDAVVDACWPWDVGYIHIFVDDYRCWPQTTLVVEVQNHYLAPFEKHMAPVIWIAQESVRIIPDILQEVHTFFRNLKRREPEENICLGEN